MRFLTQLAAVVAVSFAGGQVILLVRDDIWLALAARRLR
ncbi:acyl-CoA hydrolase [Catenuloplanes nepalensis]|uniref:Acyl-CoA hydrolase n=1 Tax=Catenuloplanes nepalensis TaxID=587533 RepID=A0ABT9MS60_9ACTN|nr:acyl-CoA hydrolase [Catenuloplanes nepalensis]